MSNFSLDIDNPKWVLVATKCDLENERMISREEIITLARNQVR